MDTSVAIDAVITATGLGVDGEHGPLFTGVGLSFPTGLHAVQLPGGHAQAALLLVLAGRIEPTSGEVSVCGATDPRAIRRHCAIAVFHAIDELEEAVTVGVVLAEQQRWLSPWYSIVSASAGYDRLVEVFGDIPAPDSDTYISDLSDLELFLLRVTLALLSERPILVVGDLEQVRDTDRRQLAAQRLSAIAEERTVVVGLTNPLGANAPAHVLHDLRDLMGGE
ncbi:hypothetical protein BayCH28_09925 [Mycolicibacterium sp. CH28]|uniref:hypothetical protein n=1 Tax=Mycolicibacterium sp. CH28 TaxID=2512237 RepID=UPI0010817329|nr:hypothetical protein [Mycolicibacterium sp. CH28]TGD88089.1 hypothetical protein BayCH28_09925 [Mycolicibacterium sp. CH28]